VPLSLSTITFDNFFEVVVRQQVTARALRNSALFAATAAFLLAVASIPCAHALDRRGGLFARFVESAFELPFALPGVVLAIAMILLFLKPLPVIGVSLYATPAIIIIAYLSRFATLAIKAPIAAIRQMPKDLEEAARSCGAGYIRRLTTVVMPIAAPAAAAGGLLVFLTAFNELTVSALLWSGGTETLGVVLFNLEEGGYATLAAAVAIVAIAIITAVMLALDAFGGRLPRGVVPWR
jgi:iron(III) transport system permease protein